MDLPELAHRAQGKANVRIWQRNSFLVVFIFLEKNIITKKLMLRLHKQDKFLMKLTVFFQRLLLHRNQNLKPRKAYYIGFSKITKNHKTTLLEGILYSY